jgi:hypothetical protein
MIQRCIEDKGCKGNGCLRIKEEIDKIHRGIVDSIEDFMVYDIRDNEDFDFTHSEDWKDRFVHRDLIFSKFFHIIKSVFNIKKVNIKSLVDTNERSAIAVRVLIFDLENFKRILDKSGVNYTEKNRNYYVAYNDAVFRIHNSLDLEEKIYLNNSVGGEHGHGGKDSQ